MRAAFLLFALGACAPELPQQWQFTSGEFTSDECKLADGGSSAAIAFPGVYERTDRTAGGAKWSPEADGRTRTAFVCDERDKDFACFGVQSNIDAAAGLHAWLRGAFSSAQDAFQGTLTIGATCMSPVCLANVDSPQRPCLSTMKVSGTLIEDKYPGGCPPPGTKPTPGEPAVLTLVKASRAEGLRISEMKEDGTFTAGGVLPTEPRDLGKTQTHIGAWFIIHRKSGTYLGCEGAFQVTVPELRMVIR